jgi:predicted phosphodiesterase
MKKPSHPPRREAGPIFFCGDTHGRFAHLLEAVQAHAPAAVVLLGDVQARQPLEQALAAILDKTQVWFIHGNHDTDTEADYDHLFGSQLASQNLHGRVVEIAGVRIAGLGGIFRGQVWRPPEPWGYASPQEFSRRQGKDDRWRGGLSLRHRSSIFPSEYAALARLGAQVLVTHEAPSVHPQGYVVLDALAQALKVEATFHGHHHDSRDYSKHWARLGHRAYGVGLCGITSLDGTVIRVGDFDDARRG